MDTKLTYSFRTLAVAVFVVIIDQLTKLWAVSNLKSTSCDSSEDACVDVIFGLKLHLVRNSGAAFSQGTNFGPFLGLLALVVSVALFYFASKKSSIFFQINLGLIAGGALGNFFDRLFRSENGFLNGSVIDFIDLGWWPVFNIADVAIVVGVGLLLISDVIFASKDD